VMLEIQHPNVAMGVNSICLGGLVHLTLRVVHVEPSPSYSIQCNCKIIMLVDDHVSKLVRN